MGRPAEQIEALQQRVRELEGRLRAYGGRVAALRTALESIAAHSAQDDAMVAAEALGDDNLEAYGAPADVPPVLGSPADIWIPNTETTKPPVLVAGDVLDEGRAAWFAEIGLKAPTPDELQAAMSAPSLLVPPPEVEHCADCGDAFEGFHACQKHIGEDEGSDP